jgi:hypothetical protein
MSSSSDLDMDAQHMEWVSVRLASDINIYSTINLQYQ